MWRFLIFLSLLANLSSTAWAGTSIPLTVALSESVTVTGTPRITVDVGGITRYATYTSGSGTNTLTFTLNPQAGDVDLDGITLSSPIDLNGGTISDMAGNNANLTFTPPNTSGIKVNYPSVGMDFVADADGRYTLNGTVYNDLSSFLSAASGSFTRASVATYFDSAGVMQTAASNTPRFDYDPTTHAQKGLLIEESRTNSLRNGNVTGSVAGSPGTLPSRWAIGGGGVGTLVQQIVGSGVENGISYVDIRYSGTASTTNFIIYLENLNFISASVGQNWQSSFYVKYSAGSLSNVSFSQVISERDSASIFLASTTTPFSITSTLTRFSMGRTLSNASVAYIANAIQFNLTNGAPVDVTLRIGGIQLERGAFATSYIPTTGSAAVTRAADSLTISSGSWLSSTAGSLFATADINALGGTGWMGFAALDDGSSNNAVHMILSDTSDTRRTEAFNAGSTIAYIAAGPVYTPGVLTKQAVGFTTNDANFVCDGVLGTVDTSFPVPALSVLRVGQGRGGASPLDGHIQKLKYYPARVPDAQLQLMTQ